MRRRVEEGVCEVDCVDPRGVAGAARAVPPEQALRRAAEAFKALANPSRLRVLRALEGRELCVCDLSRVLRLSMSGTSQHLRDLRRLGAIDFRVSGKLVYYSLADPFWSAIAARVLERPGNGEAALRGPRLPRARRVPA